MPTGSDPALDAAKRDLRRHLRAVRAAIAADPADRAARSARLWGAVAAHIDWSARPRVMMFDALPGEPDTADWMADARRRGATVLVPEVAGTALRVQPGDVDPALLNVVVVPGLGFSVDGRRLGQGGGHYDRFLPRLHDRCVTIGVCFAEQLLADVPTDPYDRCVDLVVTD